jgi:hypothetical protein
MVGRLRPQGAPAPARQEAASEALDGDAPAGLAYWEDMQGRWRKLVGTVVLVVFVAAYALIAMTIGAAKLPGTSGWVQLAYFLVAGFVWVIPAALLIRWMVKPERKHG